MKQINTTLHGLDEKLLDRDHDRSPQEEEAAFNDWLKRNGYSSKEEYCREMEAINQGEW